MAAAAPCLSLALEAAAAPSPSIPPAVAAAPSLSPAPEAAIAPSPSLPPVAAAAPFPSPAPAGSRCSLPELKAARSGHPRACSRHTKRPDPTAHSMPKLKNIAVAACPSLVSTGSW
ncbi:hypothetical protein E2562_005031 [Oryza meyeriana var. granulata]|uniref:Uncharacterized protein n=1 Tax=Oryza meyeriana var. granulata TaxID=110450 RepID=A0A6G1BSB4_9ORYZ|nr:hypothetical protein E2562_005031 [Oryza meyeriana var. granulata]